MIWTELEPNNLVSTYSICCVCKDYPAFSIIEDEEYEGPFCQKHWHEHIDKHFDDLKRHLDDEDWGSSPELAPQSPVLGTCDFCEGEVYKYYSMVQSVPGEPLKIYGICYVCYEEYSTR